MDGVERATLAAHLRQQAAALTAAWQHAIATTSFANFDRDEVRQQLTSLTDQLITILLDDAAPATGAQEIGAGVARLHYVQPEALGQTQAVLAQHLLPAIRGERRGRLELRLVLLLSELGTGFSRQVRSMLLSEQETIRAAFLQELNKAALTQAQQYASAEQARGELRAVLDAATDGMLLISHERRVLAVNRRYEELLGLPAATILGRNMADIREDLERIFEDLPALSRNMDRVANTEQRATLVLRQRWPERRELQLFSTPVRRADGTILGRLHTFRDVTQERAVQRMKDEFVGLVSHELRTPLTSIKGYVDLLLAGDVGDLTEEQREFLTIVQRNADREVTLVNDLLDLSRLEAGDLDILLAPLALGPLLTDVVSSLRPACDARGQQVSLTVPVELPLVLGNADRLTQVFTNLISNANKYTPVGGRIAVAVRVAEDQVWVAIRDSGIGLSRQEQAQLFTKFFRAKNQVAQEAGGTGLGLVITRTLVERQGGQITVESTPGQGSTFSVSLQCADLPVVGPLPGD